jgi:hypothetical protein
MGNLRTTIERLASDFAGSVIEALRSASIDELMELTNHRRRAPEASAPASRARRGKGGRLGRRSPTEIASMVDSIVSLLQKHPDGLRAEQIREALGCEAKELPRPLADGVEAGRLTKTGQKRATTYFAGSGGSSSRRRGKKKKG